MQGKPELISSDPWSIVRDESVCSPIRDGEVDYLGDTHLNGLGISRLTSPIGAAFERTLT